MTCYKRFEHIQSRNEVAILIFQIFRNWQNKALFFVHRMPYVLLPVKG